jgi:hypothetical protein
MTQELESCPFCGDVDPVSVVQERGTYVQMQCGCCRTLGPECPTTERAKAAWNRRVASRLTIKGDAKQVREAAAKEMLRCRDTIVGECEWDAAQRLAFTEAALLIRAMPIPRDGGEA